MSEVKNRGFMVVPNISGNGVPSLKLIYMEVMLLLNPFVNPSSYSVCVTKSFQVSPPPTQFQPLDVEFKNPTSQVIPDFSSLNRSPFQQK